MSGSIEAQQKELEELETIRFITGALFEVSAERINRLKDSFERNRLFYIEISDLYRSIKHIAQKRGQVSERKSSKLRGVSVAFTSNSRFYGSINSDVMNTFLNHMRVTQRDCIVIGRTGAAFMENYPEHDRCTYLSFVGDQPTETEMRQFLKRVTDYGQVYVFHPAFVNVFAQDVAVLDITHTPGLEEQELNEHASLEYIFEPELPKILHFFETRVRYLLFQRSMLEAELARTAARLMAMNAAEEKADEEIVKTKGSIRREIETFNNMRLLESFSAIKKWK
jgi:ATP synthase F1 gamma subunit